MLGMSEYIEAEREAKKEASRTEAALGSEFGAGAAEEQSTRTRQAVTKRPWASVSKGEPSQKKTRKGFEASASAQVPRIILSGTEEQEEEKEEVVSALRPRGLRSRGPAVLMEVKPAG